MAETRSADHAREMFQTLRSKYKVMTLTGAGNTLGGLGLSDSGVTTDEDEDFDDDETEDELGSHLPVVVRSRRNSLKHSITEIAVT